MHITFPVIQVINCAALVLVEHYILATRMSAIHDCLTTFDPNPEGWTEHIEHLKLYFTANENTER